MARSTSNRRDVRLDNPKGLRTNFASRFGGGSANSSDRFGRFSESFARAMGTTRFLFFLTVIVIIWLIWNSIAPRHLQFDSHLTNFTLLTLILSLQASYAAPLILLAQNRQDDRDRITVEEDRSRAAQTKADTEFLARELAALRVAIGEVATRDYLRGEVDRLRIDLEEFLAAERDGEPHPVPEAGKRGKKDKTARDVMRIERRGDDGPG
jgi:uncharacterized membrane protein